MRIVVVGTRGIPHIIGGVETHCEQLYPLLVSLGYDVHVVRRKPYCDFPQSSYKGVVLHDLPVPQYKFLEAFVHTTRAILYARFTLHADAIHMHATGPALLTPLARLLGLKVVFTHHGPDYEREKWGKLAKRVIQFGERLGVTFAHQVIVISTVIQSLVSTLYGRQDSHLIYNGVLPARFRSDDACLKELGLRTRKYVLALGRFVPEKNFHHLLEIQDAIRALGYELVLAGDDPHTTRYSEDLKRRARAQGAILPGYVQGEQLEALLSHAALFVLPSSHEGLPIALLEAMSYQLPVLVSNIPANLAVGLDSSCYFNLNDLQHLKQQLESLLKPSYTSVSYDLRPYQWNHIAQQVAKVYDLLDS